MNSLNSTILPLTYLGNIFYYIHLIKGGCTIDINSHYIKQTYTNRCSIITANGVQGGLPIVLWGFIERWEQRHGLVLEQDIVLLIYEKERDCVAGLGQGAVQPDLVLRGGQGKLYLFAREGFFIADLVLIYG